MTLPVFSDGDLVAELHASPEGAVLRYDPSWRSRRDAFPVSLTMPLAAADHGPEVVTPWLMNLLPEGEPLRAAGRALGVARDDVLGFVVELGRDLAGALTIGQVRSGVRPDFVPVVGEAALERIIEELPARPFLVGEEGVSMSLAGAQEKLPLARVGEGLAIPVNGAASDVILKPDNPRLPGSVQNEAFCMVLALRCGLPVARVTTGRAGARRFLLVDRYDRVRQDDGVRRLHQEDFCQALGRPPGAKYEHNRTGVRGPSLAEMFALVREHMTAREINALLDAVIFNVAVGNVDAHAKNYSALLLPGGTVRLAPLYDLMSGLAWPRITQNHAQDIGGQSRGRHIYARHWRRLAQACGLAAPATLRRVRDICGRILRGIDDAAAAVTLMPAGPDPMLPSFVEQVRARTRLVHDHAAVEGPPDLAEPADEPVGGLRYDR